MTLTALESIDSGSGGGETLTEENVKLRQERLASTFRNLMTAGQSYEGPNDYRNCLYKKVTQLADEVSFRECPLLARMTFFKSSRMVVNDVRTPRNCNQHLTRTVEMR